MCLGGNTGLGVETAVRCIYIYIYIYIYTYMYLYTHLDMYTCSSMCLNTYVYSYMYTYVYTNIYTYITGGNTGLGLETAVRLAALGGEVIILCRNPVNAQKAVEEIKLRYAFIYIYVYIHIYIYLHVYKYIYVSWQPYLVYMYMNILIHIYFHWYIYVYRSGSSLVAALPLDLGNLNEVAKCVGVVQYFLGMCFIFYSSFIPLYTSQLM
jgi:hypothetical protein